MNIISKQLINIAREIQIASQYKLTDENDLFPTKESFIKFLKEHNAIFRANIRLKNNIMNVYLDMVDDDAFTFIKDNIMHSENINKYIMQLRHSIGAVDGTGYDPRYHAICTFTIRDLEKNFGIKMGLINSILDIIDHSKLYKKIKAKITEKIGDNIEGIPFEVNKLL